MSETASVYSHGSGTKSTREFLSIPLADDTSSITQAGLRQTSLMSNLDLYSKLKKKTPNHFAFTAAPMPMPQTRSVPSGIPNRPLDRFQQPRAPALAGPKRVQRQDHPQNHYFQISPQRSMSLLPSPRSSNTSQLSLNRTSVSTQSSQSEVLHAKIEQLEKTLGDVRLENDELRREHSAGRNIRTSLELQELQELQSMNDNIINENSMLIQERSKLKSEIADLSHELSRCMKIIHDQERTIVKQREVKKSHRSSLHKSATYKINLQYEVLREEDEEEEKETPSHYDGDLTVSRTPRVPPRPLSLVLSLSLSRSDESHWEELLASQADQVDVQPFTTMGDKITSWQEFIQHYRTLRARYSALKLEQGSTETPMLVTKMEQELVAVREALLQLEILNEKYVVNELGMNATMEEMKEQHSQEMATAEKKLIEKQSEELARRETELRVKHIQELSLRDAELSKTRISLPVPESPRAKHVDALFRSLDPFTQSGSKTQPLPQVEAFAKTAQADAIYHDSFVQLVQSHTEGIENRDQKINNLVQLLAQERRLLASLCVGSRGMSLYDMEDMDYTDLSSSVSMNGDESYTPSSEVSADEVFETKEKLLPGKRVKKRRVGIRFIDVV
ncbi:hypothetical protein BABINDRAFT_159745 [Babjeviella inositovora NRRL Y-12698]|uniref:Uncharacterized protein n=1 Tax=Babjeviella inositovora NRRL Y-12698 TaxID=984486 RepID=A0A1E3QUW9_9ASCO|nr:uncharacterized protein BABINDRAFT_159745 [Babjeviella inositovora NRRL Y-12698]ODQ81458.1 hypothetical protein BABINDRAFT_159745 [Babjeviella inositovora NRRL Y-12698]